MRKEVATFKAIIAGDASIDFSYRKSIKRTPGDTTEMAHN
jgi:hypothetical protein